MSALPSALDNNTDPRTSYLQHSLSPHPHHLPSFAPDASSAQHLAQPQAPMHSNTVPFPSYPQHLYTNDAFYYPSHPSASHQLQSQHREFTFGPVQDWSGVNSYGMMSTFNDSRPIAYEHSYLHVDSSTPSRPSALSPEPSLYSLSQATPSLSPAEASPSLPAAAPLHEPSPGPSGKADSKDLPSQKLSKPSELDPYAADFLRAELGDAKWGIFTARLAERRVGKHRSKSKLAAALLLASQDASTGPAEESGAAGTASVIDFLVKVELVKAVLRAYVPHPYNPLKSLAHPYDRAPTGHVMLTRSAVLSLCGWSNTQFSYWARRAEAVSVLAPHDVRLRTVAGALLRHLRASDILGDSSSGTPTPSEEKGFIAPNTAPNSAPLPSGSLDKRSAAEVEEWIDKYITGKGLDTLIDEVKKRSGASQFLRGRHSSLDPFGAGCAENDTQEQDPGPGGSPFLPHTSPTIPAFQADRYIHDPRTSHPHALAPYGADMDAAPPRAHAHAHNHVDAPYHVNSVALPARTLASLMMPISRKSHLTGIGASHGPGPLTASPIDTSAPDTARPTERLPLVFERPRKKRKSV